jgi:hypothetical protein
LEQRHRRLAAVTSGRYTREQLLELAKNADAGFDEQVFADALGVLGQITDDAFAEYTTPPDAIAACAGDMPNGEHRCKSDRRVETRERLARFTRESAFAL